MARNVTARKPKPAQKKAAILEYLKAGTSIREACERSGATYESFRYYRRNDEQFAAQVASIQGQVVETPERDDVPEFPEFCEKWLGFKLWAHQLQWYDVLEGRPPRDLHPSMTYEPGDPDMVIVNTPPGHAKSQTITVAYTLWRIVKDPTLSVVLVSKTQRLAIQFLLTIKSYLTNPQWKPMQEKFGPAGGFDQDAASWKADQIYFADSIRDVKEKDPTVQAIGIGGQVYGARADLIIVDDAVDNANAAHYEDQINWLTTEVGSRLPDGGKILIVGTRLAPKDLYLELRNPERYGDVSDAFDEDDDDEDNVAPWTYFAQPAVLEYKEKSRDWVTLWPECDRPSGKNIRKNPSGYYTKWSGPILARRRRRMSRQAWSRVYQQVAIPGDMTFKQDWLNRALRGYSPGLLPDGPIGRKGGMSGLRILAGLDPAAVNFTSAVVYGVDTRTGERWVLDVHNELGMRPQAMKDLMKGWAAKFGISEWRVETNAFQKFLTNDVELVQDLAKLGCSLQPHTTGNNKNDPDLGVAAMDTIFANGLVRIARPQTEGIKALLDQLGAWAPGVPQSKQKTDCVMAFWFCELRAKELVRRVEQANQFNRRTDQFRGRWEKSQRRVVSATGEQDDDPVSIWRGRRNRGVA